MASKNRSTSPTNPPTWLTDLVRDVQLLHRDVLRNESATREIREITLKNQQLLRSQRRNSTTINSPASASTPSSARPRNPSTINVSTSPFVRTNGRNPVNTRRVVKLTNENIRDNAIAIPRPTRPKSMQTPKICWYHRQFGQASTNCIEPCEFSAPSVPSRALIAERKTPQILVRVPLERATEPEQPIPTHESSDTKPADWNTLQELYEQSFPSLTDASSSDSSSESEEEEATKNQRNVQENLPQKQSQ